MTKEKKKRQRKIKSYETNVGNSKMANTAFKLYFFLKFTIYISIIIIVVIIFASFYNTITPDAELGNLEFLGVKIGSFLGPVSGIIGIIAMLVLYLMDKNLVVKIKKN